VFTYPYAASDDDQCTGGTSLHNAAAAILHDKPTSNNRHVTAHHPACMQAAGGGVTKDTLAAADACVAFVHELCERLQAPGSQDDGIRQAVQAVVDSARALLQGQAAPEQRAVVRRLQDRTNAVCRLGELESKET
jgi:hypothetical protein